MMCSCGCGRPVAPDEERRLQLAWMDALAESGSRGVLAERSAAGDALSMLEDAVRNWGCVAVIGELGRWRERWDLATHRAHTLGLLRSGDPETRRRTLREWDRQASVDARRVWLWQMEMRPDGQAGYVYAEPSQRESELAERAVAFARRMLPAYIAKRVPKPVKVSWFNERANPYVDPAFWGTPHLRGAVADHPRDGSMRLRVRQGDDELAETVAHELFHVGQVRSATPDHHDLQERDADLFGKQFRAEWEVNGVARGVTDLAWRRRGR